MAAGFNIPIAPAICDINAIWFIIISCSSIGFCMFAMAAMSIPGMPGIGKPEPIIIAISAFPAPVMLSMRA